jgi:outer membrane cobalamin receptor
MTLSRHLFVVLMMSTVATATHGQQAQSAGNGPLLHRLARLDVREVPLETALPLLGLRSGVQLAFSPDLLSGHRPVNCSCGVVTVAEALDSLLVGTGLRYRETPNRVIVGPPNDPLILSQPKPLRPFRLQVGTVLGEVLATPDSQPVVQAQIRVSGRVGEVRTDEAGRFRLTLGPGTYELTVRSLGYAPRRLEDVLVTDGDTTTVTVLLDRAPLQLRTVVITPSTYGIIGEAELVAPRTLTRRDVETRPHVGEDIYRAMDRLPGVTTDDISARLHIRGGPSDQVLEILDGLELYEPFHLKELDGALSILDVESIRELSLMTGGFSAEYGDKMAGVVSMRTVTPEPDRIKTTLGLSFMNATFKSEGSFARGAGTWLASARRGYLDIVLDITNATDEGVELSPTYYDLFGKVQYQLGARHLISGHVLHAGDAFSVVEEDGTELESGYGSSYAWLNWQADLTSALTAHTTISVGRLTRERDGRDYRGDYNDEQWLSVDERGTFDFYGLKQDWSLLVSQGLLTRWGFDLKRGFAEYDYFRWRFSDEPNKANPFGPPFYTWTDTLSIATEPDGYEVGLYLSNRIRPVSAVTTELGLRYDHQSHTGENMWGPRVNVSLDIAPRTTVRGAWGYFYQSHGLHELLVRDGDDTFYPAQWAEHRILGVEHRMIDGISIRVEAYERRVTDPRPEYRSLEPQYETVPEEGPDDRVRIAPTRSHARGIELFAKRDVGGRFAWFASYALAVAEDELDGEWVPRPYDQRHTLRLEFAYRPNPLWALSWAWQYHSPWPGTAQQYSLDTLAMGYLYWERSFGPINGERLPAYHRFDFRVSRDFPMGRGRLSVYLDVFNLYDRENAKAYDYYLEGLSATQVGVYRGTHELIGVLPTIGARWEF